MNLNGNRACSDATIQVIDDVLNARIAIELVPVAAQIDKNTNVSAVNIGLFSSGPRQAEGSPVVGCEENSQPECCRIM